MTCLTEPDVLFSSLTMERNGKEIQPYMNSNKTNLVKTTSSRALFFSQASGPYLTIRSKFSNLQTKPAHPFQRFTRTSTPNFTHTNTYSMYTEWHLPRSLVHERTLSFLKSLLPSSFIVPFIHRRRLQLISGKIQNDRRLPGSNTFVLSGKHWVFLRNPISKNLSSQNQKKGNQKKKKKTLRN